MVGVVILYHPDTSALIENIKTYIDPIDSLLVYDNSEIYDNHLEGAICAISSKIIFRHFGHNQGIAKRLNQAIDFAVQNNVNYLLMMDQDSSFKEGDIEKYIDYIINNKFSKIAQFGINCQPDFTPISNNPEKVVSLITSGSVLNMDCINEIGMFDENLFIDFVDIEFSHRVINKGYFNLQYTNIVLNHSIGMRVEGRSLVNFKISHRIIHNPKRVYYIIRNGLYLLYKKEGLTKVQKMDIYRTMMVIKNDFIYNPYIFNSYKFALKGVFDFLRNKMGKLN